MRRSAMALLSAALATLVVASAPTFAAEWPTTTTTVLVPYAAGGNTDTMARMLAQRLTQKFGTTFVVDNRVGAGGAIATALAARAAPDGQTILFASAAQIAVIPKIQHVNYDPQALTPISIFGEGPFAMAVSTKLPVKSLAEFIAYAKSHQNELVYASGGVGSISHLSSALFAKRAGLTMTHAPFSGGAPAVAALIGGQVSMYFANASEVIPLATDDRIRIIAVSSQQRIAQLPDAPAVAELFPGFYLTSWNGLVGAPHLPQTIVDSLAAETIKAAHDPDVAKTLLALGIVPIGDTPTDFAKVLAAQKALFEEAIDAAALNQP